MRKKHQNTIQSRLFTYYSIFFISFLIIIAFFLYVFFTDYTSGNVRIQQEQLSSSIVHSLDQEILNMNNLSMSIVYSNLVKDHFQRNLTPAIDTDHINPEEYRQVTTLIDVILNVITSTQTAKQANIYDLHRTMIGAGQFNGQISADVKNKPWHKETMARNGVKYISIIDLLHLPLPMRPYNNEQNYVALTRVYKDRNYIEQGIIEILQDSSTFFGYLYELQEANPHLHIYVLDKDQTLIYPLDPNQQEIGIYYNSYIEDLFLDPLQTHSLSSPVDGSTQILTYSTSNQSDWTIIITQPEEVLFAYVRQLNIIFILLLLLALLLTLFVTYVVSKKVTQPLMKLQQAIKNINIDNLSSRNAYIPLENKSTMIEIKDLTDSFNRTNKKLADSLHQLLEARQQEMNAKFLALQSQMNPHFLYNNLTNISVMAEEGMNPEIVKLCNNMSYMLRYISTENHKGVSISAEIDYTEKYLNLMKIRYEDNFTYFIDISESLKEIIIPKLVIQPLVENCIKHGLNNSPPWHIHIEGKIESNKWIIRVTDNGTGFDPQVLSQLNLFFQSFKAVSEAPSLKVDGMGLKNIFIRLKHLYQEDAYMEIVNLPDMGASIYIGGRIHPEKER